MREKIDLSRFGPALTFGDAWPTLQFEMGEDAKAADLLAVGIDGRLVRRTGEIVVAGYAGRDMKAGEKVSLVAGRAEIT